MKNQLVLFNGPPRVGKDTAAHLVWSDPRTYPAYHSMFEKFSAPMKMTIHTWFGMTTDNCFEGPLEKMKEEVLPVLGVSYRQAQIDMSEKYMKPLYGNAIFGKLITERINRRLSLLQSLTNDKHKLLVVVSDCGFKEEAHYCAEQLSEEFDITLVRLYRDGCTFAGDSRSYVALNRLDVRQLDIVNNGTKEELQSRLANDLPDIFVGGIPIDR